MAEGSLGPQVVPGSETLSRIFATIYGQCCGDALGLLTEFLEKREAKLYYGSVAEKLEYNHKSIVSDFHRMRWNEGDWTDDSDQMILILLSIIDNGGKREIDYKDFAKKLKQWQKSGFAELGDFAGMGIGKTTMTVLNNPSYLDDPHAASFLVWDSSQRQIAPNGAVMRTSVIGIHHYWDLEAVRENAINCAKITHADPRCLASTVAVSTAIAIMLKRDPEFIDKKGKYSVDKIINKAFDEASSCLTTKEEKKELRTFLNCTNIKALKLDEQGKIGYTYKSMGSAFWAFKQDNFRKAITKIVMQGGDADSNACVGGALLGCKLGFEAIPPSWIEKLKHKSWLDQKVERYLSVMGWRSETEKPKDLRASTNETDDQ